MERTKWKVKRGRWFRLDLVLIFLALVAIRLLVATGPATTKMIVPTSMNGIIDEVAQLNDTFSTLLAEYQVASQAYQDYLGQNPVFLNRPSFKCPSRWTISRPGF